MRRTTLPRQPQPLRGVALQWAILAHCPSGRRFATSKTAPGSFVAMLYRGIFEWRYHATNSPGANLDSFSWPRSGEPQGGGEQLSTVKPEKRQANSLAWRRLNAPSSARGMKAPHKAKEPTQSSGLFALSATRGYYSRTTATALRWWHCAGLPWPASLHDLPAAVQLRS